MELCFGVGFDLNYFDVHAVINIFGEWLQLKPLVRSPDEQALEDPMIFFSFAIQSIFTVNLLFIVAVEIVKDVGGLDFGFEFFFSFPQAFLIVLVQIHPTFFLLQVQFCHLFPSEFSSSEKLGFGFLGWVFFQESASAEVNQAIAVEFILAVNLPTTLVFGLTLDDVFRLYVSTDQVD